jgi:hypothetical protein
MRFAKPALGMTLIIGVLLLGGAAAFGSSTPTGGIINVFATQSSGVGGTIVITGAIGDYGKTYETTKSGKVKLNGQYEKIVLHKGTFRIHAVALNAQFANVQPTTYATTCSAQFTGSGRSRCSAAQGSTRASLEL